MSSRMEPEPKCLAHDWRKLSVKPTHSSAPEVSQSGGFTGISRVKSEMLYRLSYAPP